MATLLQPAYTLTLGTQQWTNQAASLEVELACAPGVDRLSVTFPAAATPSAAVGDPVVLNLSNGEADADIFTGIITSLDRSEREIRVGALDAGGTLARFYPATTYEQITAGNLVRSLCSDAGVNTGDIDDGVTLPFYAADPGRSALDHISRVCGWSGSVAMISAANELVAPIVNAAVPELALRYGREIVSMRSFTRPSDITSFTVAGESGAGDTSAPEAFRMTTDFFSGNRPQGPSIDRRWRTEPALRTAQTAARAGAAMQRRYGSSRARGTFRAFLQPKIRAGVILEVQDLPSGLPQGPLWVQQVHHTIDHTGALTRVGFFQGGDNFDPSALLGSLAGAIGGL